MPVLRCGPLEIDLERVAVRLNGAGIAVTFQEFKLLVGLAMQKGRIVSREELIAQAWGQHQHVSLRTVDVHIRRLRGKLDDEGSGMIETVYQRGYRLVIDRVPDGASQAEALSTTEA